MTEQNASLIPFHGKTIEAILHQGQPHIVVRRVCGHLGIDPAGQRVKLRSKKLGGVMIASPLLGDQEAFCLPLRSFPMWLASINPRKVREELRPMLEAYQTEAADVLYRHFFGLNRVDPVEEMRARLAEMERRVAGAESVVSVMPLLTQIMGQQTEQQRQIGDLLGQIKKSAPKRSAQIDLPLTPREPERLIEVDELLEIWRQKRWPKCPPTRTALLRRLQRGFNGGPKSLWYEMAELGQRNRRGREPRWLLSKVKVLLER